MSRRIEDIWERDGLATRVLAPLAWVYGAITGIRNAAYDTGVLRSHALGLPTVSVGNLSVGGTGKTPVSAWVAQELARRGARPAILLRGYGDDEPRVHARLTPGAIIVADPDRVAGARRARAAGATVLVLDDGFQHRRARRDLDLVLVAAEQGAARRRLPAGPLREPARALRRADALLVTRKTASAQEAEEVGERWSRAAPGIAVIHLHLGAGELRPAVPAPGAPPPPVPRLAGRRVLAVSAIGAPEAFEGQLRAAGAEVERARFPDHHAFGDSDVRELARRAEAAGLVVCTLKDAVKLGERWPRHAPPLWYLSQAVSVERGADRLAGLFDALAATPPLSP
jgi:tetraacyldisaccharide 4'-kinase